MPWQGPPHDGPLLALVGWLHGGRTLAERVRLVRFRRVRGGAEVVVPSDDVNDNDDNEQKANDESDDGGRTDGVAADQQG